MSLADLAEVVTDEVTPSAVAGVATPASLAGVITVGVASLCPWPIQGGHPWPVLE